MSLPQPKYRGLQPGLSGVSWRSDKLWNKPYKNSLYVGSCYLSIVQWKFQPNLSVLDESSPSAKLWSSTLEYISTIPGCSAIRWGVQESRNQEYLCLLVQWQDPMSWRRFQKSMALSLMLGVLAENPSNRCACLELPATASNNLTIVRIVAGPEVTTEQRYMITSRVETLRSQQTGGSMYVLGAWLEDDVHSREDPEQVTPKSFYALVLGEFVRARQVSDQLVKELPSIFTTMCKQLTLSSTMLRSTLSEEIQLPEKPEDGSVWQGFSSLLRESPCRRYSESTGINYNQDAVQEKTLQATWTGEREFPGPHGSYFQTGHINEYMDLGFLQNAREPRANCVWLRFKPGALDSENLVKLFIDFRWTIREAKGCSDLIWCQSATEPARCMMIIYWSTADACTSNSEFLHEKTRTFMDTTSSLAQEPSIISFWPGFDTSWRSRHNFMPLLELVTFEVDDDASTRSLVEQFYQDLQATTTTNIRPVGAPEPKACDAKFYFYEQLLHLPVLVPTTSAEEGKTKTLLFSGVIGWKSKEAMNDWCKEYAEGMSIYERLGHQIDALQCVCPGVKNAESKMMIVHEHSRSGRRSKGSKRLGI